MTSGRTEGTEYQLRRLLRQDYRRQLQGLPISRRALLTTTVEKATHESIGATCEERQATKGESNMTTDLDQIVTLMAQIVQCQEERQQQKEERQQREKEYR